MTSKKDLRFQLTFEHIDWWYFIETAERAKNLNAQLEDLNKPSTS
jgi:hypothetical protein